MENKSKTIYPCLWFENNAVEAAHYYCNIFPNSKIISESEIVVHFTLNGNRFMALNQRTLNNKFNESVSFVIQCNTQEEIDHYWNNLTANGGKESMCGWCSDKYGVSWQVIPTVLEELMADTKRSPRVVEAFLRMKKFDIDAILNA